MTIREAIKKAKEKYLWTFDRSEPCVCVDVVFETLDGDFDETEFELCTDDKENELEDLWKNMCREMNSGENFVIGISNVYVPLPFC